MKWKNILLASLLTTGFSGLTNLDVQAASKSSKDITPPAIPSYNVNKYINLSNEANFEIKGKGEANSTVLITLKDSKTTLSLTSKTDAKGSFKVKANTKKLVQGKITLSIQNVDKAGNKSKLKTANLTKDITLEDMAIDNEGFINTLTQSEYPVSGVADLGSKIEIALQSGKTIVTGKGKVDELGNFSVDLNATALKNGNVKITVKQIDVAGNSETQTVNVIKDTTTPGKPVLSQPSVLTSETVESYIVSGKGIKNGEVEITLSDGVNDVSSVGTVDEKGFFQIELNAASLQDGELTITAKQTNEAGNESSETTVKTSKDTVGPAKPVFDTLAGISLTNQADYTISGQGDKGSAVQVLITDGTTTIKAKGIVEETGKFTIKANVSSLKAGYVTIIVELKDSNNNSGAFGTTMVYKQ